MSERDFQFKGRDFRLSKINAMRQYHLVRKLGPIVSDLLPAMKEAQKLNLVGKPETWTEEQQLEVVAKFATPVMNGLSKLSDVDAEYVLMELLSAVEMKQATGNWARIAKDSLLMFSDMELPELIYLAGRGLMFNFAGFLAALPQPS